MSNKTFYEFLGVSPAATSTEIETAYESQYNRWRRLVTHHDPTVVNQANQTLQALEQIRATLTDPKRRTAYDAGLEASGGLATDEAVSQTPGPRGNPISPFMSAGHPPVEEKPERVDAWVCPKCQTANAIGSKHCRKCGQIIGVTCPQCNNLVESTGFCTSCGADLPKAVRKKELQGEIERTNAEIEQVEAYDPRRNDEVKKFRKATVAAGAWMGFGAAGFVAVVMGWKDFVLSELHLPVLSGVLIALGIYAIWVFVLMFGRGASSTSAFWATLNVLITAGFPALSYVFTEYLYGPDFIAISLAARLVLGLITLIAAMGLCGQLGRWTWVLFLLILPAAPAAVLWDGWYLLYQIGEAPPLWDYIELLALAQLAGYIVLSVSFGLLALRGWWMTHRIEYEVAAAFYKKEANLKALQYQLRQFEIELTALQRT